MFSKYDPTAHYPEIPVGAPRLAYEKPELGKNYWILDHALDAAKEISNRCFNSKKWMSGHPYTAEKWPGKRAKNALKRNELDQIETWVKQTLGTERLWVQQTSNNTVVNFNVAQKVGVKECNPLPHTDSRHLCRYAAVLYLAPNPDIEAGTSFYRLRYPNGAVGGNMVMAPYQNLRDALNVQNLPPEAWCEELRVDNVFNRLLLYKANLVHGATGYFGTAKRDKRLTAVFFWMTE